MFDRKGVFTIPVNGKDPDEFEMELIEAGADDIERDTNEDDETIFTVYTSMEGFVAFQKKLDELGIEATNASLQRIPNNMKELSTSEGVSVLKMIEAFEDDDDVQNVFHNLEVTEEMEAAME